MPITLDTLNHQNTGDVGVRDHLLDAVMRVAVWKRAQCTPGKAYDVIDDFIDALSQHPYFVAKRRAALAAMAKTGSAERSGVT
ncbi:MAG: hypothetical protein AAF700_14985 [Pseudomonadota bacterium]